TLISLQNRTTGAFAPRNRSADVTGLASQWSLIMLASQLFEQGPVAQCESDPSIDGTLDLGGNAEFDGSGSFHLDPIGEIVSYSWTFGDGATANGQIVSHAYAAEGIYQARLTVTDANGLTDSALCPIDVRRNNIPPNAEIARPYTYCEGDTITLDGSASRDLGEDGGIVAYDWDYTLPLNFAAIDASGAQVDATALFAAPGVYDVGLRVTDTDGEHAFEFASFEVLSAADPRCNQPPVARCQDVTIDADAQCGACVDINAGSSDPDGDALTITAEPGCDFPLGSTQVTLTVSDGKLQDTCTATVTVVDASAPTATCQGDRVECGGPATAVNTACTGSDNCGAPTVTSTAQGTYGPGSHSFDCTATDAAGNSTTEFCTVEVIDSTAPTAACTGDVQECTGALTAVVTTCTAEDLCAGGEIAAQSDAEAAYALGNHSFTCGAVDAAGNSDAIECAVLIADTLAPSIECAAPVTVSAEADRCVGLVATPGATASDICEGDLATAANPDQGEWVLGTTAVTHTTADSSGNGASCETAVTVIDDTAPTAACNAFDIAPNQAPTAFTATATDNCSVESITVVAYDCWKINGAGKRMSKLESCEVAIDGDTITINDVGGVGTHIDWTVVTVDGSGNSTTTECGITGLHPNGNGDNVGCNQGVGNGEEGCDPGNSNQGNPDNTNDEPSSDGTGTPGNPGKKGGKK
ncbi:MAG: PKD domain-containing protein, partial [Myxococcales bacterium]|nr:PKD domain-containing protein [Myxococcales bacterium]